MILTMGSQYQDKEASQSSQDANLPEIQTVVTREEDVPKAEIMKRTKVMTGKEEERDHQAGNKIVVEQSVETNPEKKETDLVKAGQEMKAIASPLHEEENRLLLDNTKHI